MGQICIFVKNLPYLSTILPSLYLVHKDLTDKLYKVSDLIIHYGGSVPMDTQSPPKRQSVITPVTLPKTNTIPLQSTEEYPKRGTWADKLLYALNQIGRPAIVNEIADFIMKEEAFDSVKFVIKTISQYASNLGIAGEIGVDSSGYRNKYFLKS
ncbi:hypothetical protein F0919_00780 [Taibaiella lutea]|uniref:Uncharacterized protein n=1 Tax=Taibaiella lutea TaxID=2608001 RepID=A0A5M6CMF8_9BACT|nr:hypothetical protein [Taibaiella lutea]KAA5536233.1 hypothetical protein F0919_00780 [Taibaiella lutea]